MMNGPSASEQTPGFIAAGRLLRVVGFLFFLFSVVFNRALISFLAPGSSQDVVTVHGIWHAQRVFAFSALALFLLAEVAHPSALHRLCRKILNKPLALNLLLLLLSLATPLLLFEVALRPFTIDHLDKKSTSIFVRDPDLGWRLRPGSRGWWGDVEVQINGKGLRGPEIPYERGDSSLRLLYLGDSVTFGYKLPEHQLSFPYVVEDLLEQKRRLTVETVNTGVGGYSPWQYDIYLRKQGVKYTPDVVILGFVLNDVTEKFNLVRFGGNGPGSQLSRSYFSLDDWLAHNSGIYVVTKRLANRMRFGENPRRAATDRERVFVEDLARHPNSERVEKAWEVTLENLGRVSEYCREKNLPLLIIGFPFTFQFEDPVSLDSPQRVLQSFCQAREIPFLDLLPPLSRHLEEHQKTPKDLFLDKDHLSAQGSRVVADLIVRFLEQEVALEDTSSN